MPSLEAGRPQTSCEGIIAAYEGRNSTAQEPFDTLNTLEDIWLLSSMGSFPLEAIFRTMSQFSSQG